MRFGDRFPAAMQRPDGYAKSTGYFSHGDIHEASVQNLADGQILIHLYPRPA
jgi:hypothetical protein